MSHLPPPPPTPTPQRASTHIGLASAGAVLGVVLLAGGVIANAPAIGALGVLVGLISMLWLIVAIILAVAVARR